MNYIFKVQTSLTSNMSRFCCRYKIQFLQSKGAILVLLWDIIISLYKEFFRVLMVYAIEIIYPTEIEKVNNTVLNVTYLVCCVVPWLV